MMNRFFPLFIAVLFNISTNAQIVSANGNGNVDDAIAIDQQGNIYVSYFSGGSIYKFDSSGNATVFKGGLSNPNGLAVSDSNHLFVCEFGGNRIRKYDTSGTLLRTYTSFTSPSGIIPIAGTNDFYIGEYNTNRLKRLQQDGTVTLLHSGSPLSGPVGFAYIRDTLCIANFNNRVIHKYVNGTFIPVATLPSSGTNFNNIGFMTALGGQLYATHIGGHKIYRIDPSNGQTSVYSGSSRGSTNGPISMARFDLPNGIFADTLTDRILISEFGPNNLRIISNISVGIAESPNETLRLNTYPNPCTNELYIDLTGISGKAYDIQISSVSGELILDKTYHIPNADWQTVINTESWSSGTYLMRVQLNGKQLSKKFIVQ